MKKTIAITIFTLSVLIWNCASAAIDGNDLMPRPSHVKIAKEEIKISGIDKLSFNIKGSDTYLSGWLADQGFNVDGGKKALVQIAMGNDSVSEAYTLTINPNKITITAPGQAGAFYGVQSLLQMVRAAIDDSTAIKCETITDSPRFPYRGLHFDVSRHFRSPEFLKKQIDAMAAMKMNRLHLHFTDGAGWRMPVDKYPELTSYAAWRPQRSWMDWRDNGTKYIDEKDPRAQGGYYTKEQLRELVNYAAKRHITIIPEIEMPGHSEEVVATYPEFSCNGKGSDLCPGKEATFKFLENVLDEAMEIFPSRYIHIGGDEAGKGEWKTCPDCKKRMEQEGLNDVDELQSYLIKRIEKYINSKGRSIIGWDEILEGGVAPNATVMSWRGTEGGIKAIQSGHDVIMTPGAYCYIDYSQDAPFREPVSIGGYTPLAKVYSYEPLDSSISPEQAHHLKGVQANLWSEYITEDSHAEYMYYPRAYAIAEIGWSSPGKNYDNFHRRALAHNKRMKADGYNVFDLTDEYGERHESLTSAEHLAKGAKVIYNSAYADKYKAGGDSTFTDGVRGGWANGDGRWQGTTEDMDITVDLGEVKPIHFAQAAFMHSEGAWIHLPQYIEISTSSDGTNFSSPVRINSEFDPSYAKIIVKDFGTPLQTSARYVRLFAKQHPRPGAWLFMDEFIIN